MKISEILKQFKTIQPDPNFSEKSKRMILASPQDAPSKARDIFVFLRAIETGAAFVLVGFFILLVTGSFSGAKYLAPVQYSVIDPAGLHAEADAVDMQIQLANINYLEVTSTAESTTPAVAAEREALRVALSETASSTTSSTIMPTIDEEGTSTATSSVTVDQALQKLSE